MTTRQSWEGWAIAGAGVVLLVALAYWRTISIYAAPYRILLDQPIPDWIEALYRWRWLVRGAMVGAGLALGAVEWKTRGLSRWVRAVLSRPVPAALFVMVLALAGRSYLFGPGRLALGDALNNIANAYAIRMAVEAGHFPPYFWSNYATMGFPWLQFHNSLFYYQGALIDFLLHEPILSSKILLLGNHLLAAVTMFFCARRLTRSIWAALVSATVWATTFYHYHFFVHTGSLHISSLIPMMPLALLCAESLLAGRRLRLPLASWAFGTDFHRLTHQSESGYTLRPRSARAFAGLALATALLLWAHAFYGAVTLALVLLYCAAQLLSSPRRLAWKERGQRLAWVLSGTALGMLAGLTQWLPVFLERNLVAGWNPGAGFPHPIITWQQALTFRGSFLTPEWWGGYVGLTVFGLAMLAAVLAVVNRDRRAWGLIALLAFTSYLALGPAYLPFDKIFERIPFGEFVYAIRTPGKYLLWVEFSLALLAGMAVREVVLILRRQRLGAGWLTRARLGLVFSAIVAAEMIFISLQVNSLYPADWVGTNLGNREYFEWISANGDRTSRVLDGDLATAVFSHQPSFAGHNEESPPSIGVYLKALDRLREAVDQQDTGASTRNLLYLMDVGYTVLRGPAPPDSGWQPGFTGGPFEVWLVPEHSPAVAAPAVTPAPPEAEPDDTVQEMGLDRAEGTANFIVLPAETSVEALAVSDEPLVFDITNYQVDLTSVVLDYELSRPAYIQMGYSAYPYLRLYVDGQPHEYFSTALSFVGLASPAGAHRIELRPVLSPLRAAAYWIEAAAMLAALGLAGWEIWFGRRPRAAATTL